MRVMAILELLRLKKELNEVFDQVINEVKAATTEINIEQQGDTFYAYAVDTGNFLAQGKTLKEITDNLSERFPNVAKFHCKNKEMLNKLQETQN